MITVPTQTFRCTRTPDHAIDLHVGEQCTLLDLKRWGNAYPIVMLLAQQPPIKIFGPMGLLTQLGMTAKPSIEALLVDTFQIDFEKAAWRPHAMAALGIMQLISAGAGEKADTTSMVALQMMCGLPDILLACVEIDVKGGTLRWMVKPGNVDADPKDLRLEFGDDARFTDKAMWVEDENDLFYGRSIAKNTVMLPDEMAAIMAEAKAARAAKAP
jgi:hypothetical protein